ncbi:CoA transferase [Streptomyces sp. NPDC049906]|uniref:CoA transferase n=1 Tax=Streptomyces sp. NPDC049906 TaxID=3155656 RepID=UPI00343532E2
MTDHAHPAAPELGTVWAALGGDPTLLSRVRVTAREGALPARLPVRALARACVAGCALAAAELAAARRPGERAVPVVTVDDGAVATAFTSERQLRVAGRAPTGFAPLSTWWRTADGWVRTHANYPHHRARLLTALGAAVDLDDARAAAHLAEVLAGWRATRAEEAVYAAGGLAVSLRTPAAWAAHPQGAAVRDLPLVGRAALPGGTAALPPLDGTPLLPAAGVRVLDLTRVLAGPVATRTLALLGADVLRIDSPGRPEQDDLHTDTGFGKRSTALDLAAPSGRRALDALLARADVVVTGYRPGSLDRFGLSSEALAARRPGLVVARLSAWGPHGPWAGRRGFDSLVQAASGIARIEGGPQRPGALPAQALDHGSGYLLAAAVLRALTERQHEGTGGTVEVVLARTAAWLTGAAADPVPAGPAAKTHTGAPYTGPGRWLAERNGPAGRLRYARPPVRFAEGPADWTTPPGPQGVDPAGWRDEPT